MIAVRKVEERPRQRAPRRLSQRATLEVGVALSLYDLWLTPGERLELDAQPTSELITYVVTGTLVHALGKHTSALLAPGEFQRVALGLPQAAEHTQTNPSRSETSHVVQLLVHDPRLALDTGHAQQRFWVGQRRGLLCKVAGPAAEQGLLSVQSQLTLYSSLLDTGQHLVHAFAAAHSGVLHVVSGELNVAGHVLGPGDSAHVRDERSLAFTAREPAEALLIDVRDLTSI
jgi:redox-sensitive bicupin YhaK (pirin superfamily)